MLLGPPQKEFRTITEPILPKETFRERVRTIMKFIRHGLYALGFATAIFQSALAAELTPVRMVLPHPNIAVGEEVFLYAVPKALGFFSEEGIDVSVMTAGGSVAAGQILISNGADLAPMVAEAILAIREQGGTPKGFYSLKRNNGFTVGVPAGSKITKLGDIVGKTVGFSSTGSGPDKMLMEQLRQDGVAGSYQPISLGTGPGVMTAVKSGQVDALMMWDAIYAIFENQGMKLDHYEIPLQDKLAGYTVAATDQFIASNPKIVEGFCRATAKALHFTLTDPKAAVEIFYKEYPTLLPAGKSHDDAVSDGVNVMKAWLERAQKWLSIGDKTGYEDPARWTFTAELYAKFGQLKGTAKAEDAYTGTFFEKCNDFDRSKIEALAKDFSAKRG